MTSIAERLAKVSPSLSPAERRVAGVVVDDPEAIAFGTVASVAERAETSGPTVVRFAAKAGYEGFVGLQAGVQEELAGRLRPAAERIRHASSRDVLGVAAAREARNVHDTLEGVDRETFDRVVSLLADNRRRVHVLSGEASRGVAQIFAEHLAMLRDDVLTPYGSPVRVAREVGTVRRRDVCIAIDTRRYDRWVLDAAAQAHGAGASVVAITDSRLSPLASAAEAVLVVSAQGAGPFDSHVGTLALCNSISSSVAGRLRRAASARLDAIESAWSASGALVDP